MPNVREASHLAFNALKFSLESASAKSGTVKTFAILARRNAPGDQRVHRGPDITRTRSDQVPSCLDPR